MAKNAKGAKVKVRTHRGAAKRFKKTGSGKFKCKPSHARHILTKKGSKRKRQLRGLNIIDQSEVKRVEQMLPNA